ncbi:MAG: hypothetical protein ACYCZ6_16080 [Polaromonas sp.]
MKNELKISSRSVIVNILLISMLSGVFPMMATPAMAAEQAVTPEKSPPGDIPDSQVFVTFKSPAGFAVKVPEGWSRTERKNGVRFADKFNAVDIDISAATVPPSVASVKSVQAVDLVRTGRAIKIRSIKNVNLPAGQAVLIDFESNSEPNQVTNKQLRLESNRYLLFRNGKLATLDLAAPLGADNVDQWKLIARSFLWN